MICLDHHGNICAGVSTSGRPFKPPGRIGDSPLPGCGYYADNSVSTIYILESFALEFKCSNSNNFQISSHSMWYTQ